jgi:hypothetical protein
MIRFREPKRRIAMLKTFALATAITIACFSAATASIVPAGQAENFPAASADSLLLVAIPKNKLPPRNPFGTKPTNAGVIEEAPLQVACQTGSLKNKCRPPIRFPGSSPRST